MELTYFMLLVSLTVLIHGQEPAKRQIPPCSTYLQLSQGQKSTLTTGNNPYFYSCRWRFTCPVDMYLQCSAVVIPCPSANFIVNQYPICGSGILNSWNAGRDLSAEYYRYSQISGTGLACTVTCGSGSGGTSNSGCYCGVSQAGQSGKRSAGTNITEEGTLDVDRIVGGWTVTSQQKYPWMAYFGECEGALINDRYVLTAAHCISTDQSGKYTVTLGDLDKSTDTESRTISISSRAIVHPQYNQRTRDNDIALLKLDYPVNFQANPNIRPICLSSSAQPSTGQAVAIAGWGSTYFGGSGVSVMRETVVNVDSQTTCQNAYNNQITSNMFCASASGRDACQGDSGAPAMSWISRGYYIQIGTVSFGNGCAMPDYPGVYTRVANYVNNFILPNTNDANWCSPP